jgi:hypothetical protein
MAHVVRLDDVWTMMDACARGYQKRPSSHYWIVTFNGRTYRTLPLGEHGRRKNPEIETGHVRSMIRHLLVSRECAERHIDIR